MKISEKPITKLVASIIMILIMGVIIYFVFNYYSDVARNKTDDKEDAWDNPPEEKLEKIDFTSYKFNRVTINVNSKLFILNTLRTDAGQILSVNDNAVADISSDDKITYAVVDKYLVIYVESDTSYIVIVDDSYEAVKTYDYRRDRYFDYVLSKPLIYDKYSNYILRDSKSIYITYAINNDEKGLHLNNGLIFEEMKYEDYERYNIVDEAIVQYTLKINLDNLGEETIVKYNFADYIKNKD